MEVRLKRLAKGVIYALLVLAVALTTFAKPAVATTTTTIKVESVSAAPGDTVTVPVTIEGNPGILGATLNITYDSGLTLTGAANGDAFSMLTLTKPGALTSPSTFNWDGVELQPGDIKDGQILVLSFTVSDAVVSGAELAVSVSANAGDVFDGTLNSVDVSYVAGSVSIVSYVPGDVDGNNLVNSRDVILARRDIVGGYEQKINSDAANVNGDYSINSADIIYMRRYIAGGYGIELQPSPIHFPDPDEHVLTAVEAKSPTCTEDGNIAYWYCTDCWRYYADAACTLEISLEDTVIASLGHTVVVDEAVAPTPTSEGHTEGSHCEVCGEVLVAPIVIPPLEADEYYISYDVANGDPYLAGLNINNPNRTSYYEGDSFKLSNLSVPGYRFLGWYDGAGDDATKVTRIDSSMAENLELYAHWQVITYTVQFESDLFLDTETVTYSVDKGLALPTPKLSNYVFVGWSGDSGDILGKKIPVGTTGNITLHANWTSERNKTYTNPNPSDPVIYEDAENNILLFAYEIGRIENVPLYTINDFGYISGDGVTRTVTKTYSTTTEQTTAESIARVVADATTNSTNWTLSEGWNETTSVTEEWCEEHGLTREQAETICKSDSKNWNISNSSSGSASTTTTDVSNDGWTQDTKNTESKTDKVSGTLSANLSMKSFVPGVSAGIEASVTAESSKTKGLETNKTEYNNGSHTTSTANTSGWNNSSSYGGSCTTSQSNTVSTAVSELISQKYGYGSSYCYNGSTTQGFATTGTSSQSDSYTAEVIYGTQTSESVTSTWTTSATKAGHHRWVVAGTAHVFGVVGYDIETKSFFVYTMSIIDDETHDFEDYSNVTASYNDNENGVISFEVPYDEIMDLVSDRVYTSDGLKVNPSTGVIEEYNGTDTIVYIPEYYNAGNGDVVKITGIASDAFAGNTEIRTVILSDYITEIPAGAFAGCSSLAFVEGKGITSIGASAFAGCPNLENCGVYSKVTYLGQNAFYGADHVYVNAANPQVAAAAIASGAKSVTLNLRFLENDENVLNGVTFDIPASIDYFELNGDGRTFNGLKINSAAEETVLNKISIVGTEQGIVNLSSQRVTLNQTAFASSGIALVITSDNVDIGLRGTNTVSSTSPYAMLCRNINLYETASNVVGKLVIPQKLLICGTVGGLQFLQCSVYETINDVTFNALLHSYTVTFDAAGGTCAETSRPIVYNAAIGELPVPTRDYYTFDGWYIEGLDEKVTSSTVLTYGENVTLVAHWTEGEVSDWVRASEVPEGAQIVYTKWTYNKSIYKQVVDSYTYYRYCSNYDGKWQQDSCWINNTSTYHEITLASPMQANPNKFADQGGNAAGICGPYGSCDHKREGQSYWWLKRVNYKTVLDRVESLESATEPTGSNISNVVEWVQYRAK